MGTQAWPATSAPKPSRPEWRRVRTAGLFVLENLLLAGGYALAAWLGRCLTLTNRPPLLWPAGGLCPRRAPGAWRLAMARHPARIAARLRRLARRERCPLLLPGARLRAPDGNGPRARHRRGCSDAPPLDGADTLASQRARRRGLHAHRRPPLPRAGLRADRPRAAVERERRERRHVPARAVDLVQSPTARARCSSRRPSWCSPRPRGCSRVARAGRLALLGALFLAGGLFSWRFGRMLGVRRPVGLRLDGSMLWATLRFGSRGAVFDIRREVRPDHRPSGCCRERRRCSPRSSSSSRRGSWCSPPSPSAWPPPSRSAT